MRVCRFAIPCLLIVALVCPALAAQTPSPAFLEPLLITPAGQSADSQLASVLAKRAGLTATLSKLAAAADLEGHKTLVLVLGASMKGLGAAGLDRNKEIERVRALIAGAKAKNVPVLALHLGGEQRRGELTDDMVKEFLPAAKMAIILKSGNKDGLFTQICTDRNIPLVEVERTADAAGPLKAAFGK